MARGEDSAISFFHVSLDLLGGGAASCQRFLLRLSTRGRDEGCA